MLQFKSFRRAQAMLAGIEQVQMIRKGQDEHPCGEGLSLAEQFSLLAAVIATEPKITFLRQSRDAGKIWDSGPERHR